MTTKPKLITTAPPVSDTPSAASPTPKEATVKIAAAKGRPMLSWVGKRPLGLVTAFPAQAVERFDPQHVLGMEQPEAYAGGGLLFHGDNKEVLAHLLASGFRGKVDLIYIDPPFDSGADYVRKISLRGGGSSAKMDGETYTLGEQTQYTDIWANDNYLQFMYERLLIMKELLAETGSIFVHLDPTKTHYLRIMLDEIFGADSFRNEIIWRNTNSHNSTVSQFGPIHQNILFYTKSDKFELHPGKRPFTAGYINDRFKYSDERGIFQPNYITGPGLRKGDSGLSWNGFAPSSKGRHWAIPSTLKDFLPNQGKGYNTQAMLDMLLAEGLVILTKKAGGQPMYKQYLTEGVAYQDLWCYQPNTQNTLYKSDECIDEDVKYLEQEVELENYPTQKPEGLLRRIVESCSSPDALILDCFIGSGTTAAVAQKLDRRWIGCDINKGAIQTASKRLQSIITSQITAKDAPAAKNGKAKTTQQDLGIDDTEGTDETAAEVPATTQPAQLAFSIWRVNDYDLQIQHNEAVEIACQHLGVTRTKGDSFFDGTRGQQLVKIVPFNHPLSPLDLEEVKTALGNRPEETRPVLMVCLGVELAAQGWIEDWNRLRKVSDPNRIDYIELRTDAKYGKFFEHKAASAQVSVTRTGEMAHVKIENFISPTIVERLAQTAGVLSPKIDDWRAMVDCVLIDTNYDGSVFNVALSDVPEKKNNLVAGEYKLPLPKKGATIGVKIIDMLGEEVLETIPAL